MYIVCISICYWHQCIFMHVRTVLLPRYVQSVLINLLYITHSLTHYMNMYIVRIVPSSMVISIYMSSITMYIQTRGLNQSLFDVVPIVVNARYFTTYGVTSPSTSIF